MRSVLTRLFGRSGERGPAPTILMYHRVEDLESDPWGLAIRPSDFAAQLDFLRSERTPLALATFVDLLARSALPPDAVAISFDDGYADNYHNALPALRSAGLEATLFVAVGAIDAQRPFWWDELAGLVLDLPNPAEFELPVAGARLRVEFGDREPADFDRSAWRAWEPARTAREASYVDLWKAIRNASGEQREEAMSSLRALLGAARDGGRDRPLTSDELKATADHGWFTLGGHTVSHPMLPDLEPDEQRREIAEGRRRLEALTGRDVEGFAYPYGAMDSSARQAVIDCGFRWACSTDSHPVPARGFDLYAMPRVAAPAGDGAALERALASAP